MQTKRQSDYGSIIFYQKWVFRRPKNHETLTLAKDEGMRPKAEEEINYPLYKPTHTTPTTSITMTHFFLTLPTCLVTLVHHYTFFFFSHFFGLHVHSVSSSRLISASFVHVGELVRAQEVRLNPPRRKKGRNLEYQNEEAGYKCVATSRGWQKSK